MHIQARALATSHDLALCILYYAPSTWSEAYGACTTRCTALLRSIIRAQIARLPSPISGGVWITSSCVLACARSKGDAHHHHHIRSVAAFEPGAGRADAAGTIRIRNLSARAAALEEEEDESTKKPPPDVSVVVQPDNGLACAVRLSMAYQLQTAASLASAFSDRLTPAPSLKQELEGANL